MKFSEEDIEQFIRDNREKFDVYAIEDKHEEHFLKKLYLRFKTYISIVPYLIKVSFITLIIFISSFLVWYNFICPPLTRVSFKYFKYEIVYKYEIYKTKKLLFNNEIFKTTEDYQEAKIILFEYDNCYKNTKKDLKKYERDEDILKMLEIYKDKLNFLKQTLNKYSI